MIRRTLINLFLFFLLVYAPHLGLAQQGSESDLLSAAQQAFNDGFNDVATKYLEDFLVKYPVSLNISTAKLLLGECDFLRGDYAKALDLFEGLSQQAYKKDETLYWQGETYLKLGRLADAQRDYQSVINDFPQSSYAPQAYYSLGWSYFEQKEFSLAKKTFLHLTASFPKNPLSEDATLKVAECDYNAGLLKNAVGDFQQFTAQYPQSSHVCEVNFNIAESLYYLGSFEDAVKYYQKVRESSCEDHLKLSAYAAQGWSYIKLNKLDEASNVFKRAENFCKAKKLSDQELVLARANLAYEQSIYDEALALFSDFIQHDPKSPHWAQGYLGRANVYYLLKEYEEAKEDYLRLGDQKDPEIFSKCRFGLGWCELKLGHLPQAISYFQEVFNQSKDNEYQSDALVQMADAYQESSRWEDAAALYERIEKNFPNNDMMDYVFYRQAITLLKLGKTDAAFNGFKTLRDQFSHSKYMADFNYYMGVISFKKGDWAQSASTMERYLKNLTRPSEFTPEANYILALSLLNLKQPEDALKIFQKILRLYPNDAEIAKNADIGIAKCQFELGQDREAIKRIKLIIYKYPNTDEDFEALLWLAQYYLKNGELDAAIEYYKAIIDAFPDKGQIGQIHYELGQAYEIKGESDEALEQYQAIPQQDGHLKNKTRLAIAGIMSKDLDAPRAIAAYENIIATSPQYAGEAYLKLGQLYRNAQDYDNEVKVYQRALASDQGQMDRAQIQFNLADTLELMSRSEDAITEYLKIPVLYPNQQVWVVKAYLRIAKIYEEGEDWDAARVTYQKIIQLNVPEAAFAQERLDWIKNNARKVR